MDDTLNSRRLRPFPPAPYSSQFLQKYVRYVVILQHPLFTRSPIVSASACNKPFVSQRGLIPDSYEDRSIRGLVRSEGDTLEKLGRTVASYKFPNLDGRKMRRDGSPNNRASISVYLCSVGSSLLPPLHSPVPLDMTAGNYSCWWVLGSK